MTNFPIDETHDPARTSWVDGANGHAQFPIQNLPYGVFDSGEGERRLGVAIGDRILCLRSASDRNLLPAPEALRGRNLNALFGLRLDTRSALRRRISELLSDPAHRAAVEPLLIEAARCTLHLPAAIGDYTDFYVGIHHANNVGRLFRPENPLLPNYKWVPIGYHGRASSVRPSDVPVTRPNGQRKAPDAAAPIFGPTLRLDHELEMGIWIGRGNALGHPIPIGEAGQHIAGFCLLNDWSARDFQAWEYQPLGPFLAKNFHTTISPWVVTSEALAPFRTAQPRRPEGDPEPLPYLLDAADQREGALAIELEAHLSTKAMREQRLPPHRLSRGQATNMYWTAAQIVTHHASNGCNLQAGDLLGTGTISAPSEDGFGSLLEITHGGTRSITLPGGETRTFLEDGDTLTLTATARADGYAPIGFGPCRATVLPAPSAERFHVDPATQFDPPPDVDRP